MTPGCVLLLAVFVYVSGGGLVLCALSAVLLHEAAHGALLALFGAGVAEVEFSAAGGRMVPARPLRLSPLREAAVCLGGPAVNLAAAPLFYYLCGGWPWGQVLSGVHLAAGLLNLLPAEGLDGARALCCLLPEGRALRAVRRLTRIIGGAALAGGGWLLCRYRNPALLIFGGFCTIAGRGEMEYNRIKSKKDGKK